MPKILRITKYIHYVKQWRGVCELISSTGSERCVGGNYSR